MNISTFQSNLDFIKSIYFHEEWKDEKCRDEILEVLEEANKKILDAFGKSMHRLGKHKPSQEAVEKLVKKFPSTLSYENLVEERLPIHTAAADDDEISAPEYVPVLAKEGLKHQVGGEDARGGLLVRDPYDCSNNENILQMLCYYEGKSNEIRRSKLAALKELRKMGLFVKKDIVEQNLLYQSLWDDENDIFDYLVDWDPDSLMDSRYFGNYLIHSSLINTISLSCIEKLLKAGFKYHPHIGGILFLENNSGTTSLDSFLHDEESAKDFMDKLYDILTPTKDYPILHHIFTKAPQHKELFAKKFPWAGSLKDHNGRSLHQAILAAGPEVMTQNEVLFAMLTDNQIQKKDPITTLFPFAAMAVGDNADLEKSFYLLRRHPSVLDRRSRANSTVRRPRKKQKVSK